MTFQKQPPPRMRAEVWNPDSGGLLAIPSLPLVLELGGQIKSASS